MRPEILYSTWFALLGLMAVAALLRGSPSLRVMVLTYLVASVASLFVTKHNGWSNPQLGLLLVDALTALVFFGVLLRSDKIWVMVANGGQWLIVVVHLVRLFGGAGRGAGYATLLLILSWLVLATLAFGTVRAIGRPNRPARDGRGAH